MLSSHVVSIQQPKLHKNNWANPDETMFVVASTISTLANPRIRLHHYLFRQFFPKLFSAKNNSIIFHYRSTEINYGRRVWTANLFWCLLLSQNYLQWVTRFLCSLAIHWFIDLSLLFSLRKKKLFHSFVHSEDSSDAFFFSHFMYSSQKNMEATFLLSSHALQRTLWVPL